jgi:hypothetical protein
MVGDPHRATARQGRAPSSSPGIYRAAFVVGVTGTVGSRGPQFASCAKHVSLPAFPRNVSHSLSHIADRPDPPRWTDRSLSRGCRHLVFASLLDAESEGESVQGSPARGRLPGRCDRVRRLPCDRSHFGQQYFPDQLPRSSSVSSPRPGLIWTKGHLLAIVTN